MAVINNTFSQIGDVLVIKADPVTGVTAVTGFTESVSGVTATRFFTKEFRYSLDGINFTDYQALTNPLVSAIPVNKYIDLVVEFRYTRAGTDTTGVLTLNSVSLNTTLITWNNGQTYDSSVFKHFFNNNHSELLKWSLNVLEKLYKRGIVPSYIDRDKNNNANDEDRDYIDFWRIVTTYYATLVKYSREFRDITNNRELLLKYLRHRGVFLCSGTTLVDLQYIMKNYWDEMRHRGTLLVTKPKGEVINGNAKPVNGELLRLLCFNSTCDEFLFGISEFNRMGWVGNEWSPLYQGLTDQTQFNKFYEKYKNVTDLTKYPLLNSGNVSIVNDATIPETNTSLLASPGTMLISAPAAGQKAGVGSAAYSATAAINVNSSLSYELSFYVKRVSGSPRISVRAKGYDCTGTQKDLQDASNAAFPTTENMVVQAGLVNMTDWVLVRCIIHKSTHVFDANSAVTTPSINVGNNLRMTSDVKKIIPEIVVDNGASNSTGSVRVWNMRLAPATTPYSTGFLEAANVVQTWMQNNGGSYSNAQVTEIMKYYLLPYQTILINNFL